MATRIVIKDTNSRKQVSYYQNTHQVGATDNAQHGTQIAEDTGELLNVGRKSRKAVEEREVQRKTLTGSQAFERYLLCYQLVLWKQVYWLISVQKLPEEFESVVKELWSLRLGSFEGRTNYESETDTEGQSQVFSSQSEAETATDTEASQASRKRRKKTDGFPALVETLSLCYIGALLLRIPLLVSKLHQWATDGDLLYYKSVKQLPTVMTERLPGEYHLGLDPQNLLTPDAIHSAVLKLATLYGQNFGMATPPINTPLFLYQYVESLALPLEVYSATRRLESITKTDFTVQTNAAAKSNVALRYPEVQLVCLLVVATKLLFSFDDIARNPRASTELSALSMDWRVWITKRQEDVHRKNAPTKLSYPEASQVTESDVLQMTEDKLDQYLDWYGQTMASEGAKEGSHASQDEDFRRAMFRFFPVHEDRPHTKDNNSKPSGDATAGTARLMSLQASLRPREVVSDKSSVNMEVHRPGSLYRRYRKVEELEGPAKVFYEAAADLAGISSASFVRAVFRTESKLQTWAENERRER